MEEMVVTSEVVPARCMFKCSCLKGSECRLESCTFNYGGWGMGGGGGGCMLGCCTVCRVTESICLIAVMCKGVGEVRAGSLSCLRG